MGAIIYQIVNKINGKIYVGQTVRSLKKRQADHLTRLRDNSHKCTHLQNAYNCYGEDAFYFIILEELPKSSPQKDIDARESFWIAHFNAMDTSYGYNKRDAGKNGHMSEESKSKIRAARKNTKHSAATKRKISRALKNRHLSDETKRRISEAMKAKVASY